MSNPRIEEVASDNEDGAVESGSGSSDEMPALKQASSSASAAPQGARKQTRAEKKVLVVVVVVVVVVRAIECLLSA